MIGLNKECRPIHDIYTVIVAVTGPVFLHREANRYDAVATLEANLKELQGEYKKQQRLMNP